jgi:hypothetical protein
MSTPAPDTSRDAERKQKLESKVAPEERRRLIEEHGERGRSETAERREDKKTEAPKPKPYRTVGEPEGRSTVDILKERGADTEKALEEMESGKEKKEE